MNIKEIAKKAGVSVATVSRVLNHPENVAEETKNRIRSVMEESDYTPNWFARGLNMKKTNTLGLIIPDMLNPEYMEIAKGVEDVAHQKNCTILMCNCENDIEKERRYADIFLKRRIDGIVLISSLLKNEDIEEFKKQSIPVVSIGENSSLTGIGKVTIDCREAAKKAVEHLIKNGRKEIAFLYGKMPLKENCEKLEGYKDALKEKGIDVKKEYFVETENNAEDGYLTVKKFMAKKRRPNAIFASSDTLAIGAVACLRDSGIKVPEDVAVVGFDNIQMSKMIEPKLTTVDKPMHKMGVVGARLLFDIIDEENSESREEMNSEIMLRCKLKIRRSCGHKERIGEIF